MRGPLGANERHVVARGKVAPLLVSPDLTHSRAENRFYALGQTAAGRRLFVVFTLRNTLIRVISARDMSRRERKVYADAEASEAQS